MKKGIVIIIISIVLALFLILGALVLGPLLFSQQYNSNGVSHYLIIEMDKTREKEYIGELDECKVYAEGMNVEHLYFRTIDAENLHIKDAIKDKKVSVKDWKKHAWNLIETGKEEILRFENYEIGINFEECVIRPITK